MNMKMYVIYSIIDNQEYGRFKTLKEAKQQIKNLYEFDKEEHNPFNEHYYIEVE